jgi:tetratricopeptide (TPR) repeat protein
MMDLLSTETFHKYRVPVVCVFLGLLCLAVYGQLHDAPFIQLDDSEYVTTNKHVTSGLTWDNVIWAFTTNHASNWHPLTWLSLMLDCELFGANPGALHLVNVAYHIASALVLFGALKYMTGSVWRSAFVAGLFALHPLHVESVAWITERKDVLSGLFWMLTMWAYAWYARRGTAAAYLTAFVLFVLGLMAKPMLVTLPFVLLILDYWPLGRFESAARHSQKRQGSRDSGWSGVFPPIPWILLREKLSFFAAGAASSVVTFIVQQRSGAVRTLLHFSVDFRIANALVSYVRYMAKTVWPSSLAIFYPSFQKLPLWPAVGSAVVLVAISFAVHKLRYKRWLTVGWLWYLGTLVPVIGLVQVGGQAIADRYTYLPLIGLFLVAAWGANEALGRLARGQMILVSAAVAVLTALSVRTWVQVGYWQDNIKLFSYAIEVTPGNHIAHECLGHALVQAGQPDQAKHHYEQALRIKPYGARAEFSLAQLFFRDRKIDQAIRHYRLAILYDKDYVEAYYYLANTLVVQKKFDEAIEYYRKVLQLDPEHSEACNNLALALADVGDVDNAIKYFDKSLRLNPDSPEVHNNLANALAKRQRLVEATAHYQMALRLRPDFTEAHYSFADVLKQLAQFDEAIEHYRRALALNPQNPDAHNGLGQCLVEQKNYSEAIEHLRTAIRLNPDLDRAYYNLGLAYFNTGNIDGAIEQFRQVLRIHPQDAEMHSNLGTVLAQKGLVEEAISELRTALRYAPKLLRAQQQLESLLAAPAEQKDLDF